MPVTKSVPMAGECPMKAAWVDEVLARIAARTMPVEQRETGLGSIATPSSVSEGEE
jgi:hypothetical protein